LQENFVQAPSFSTTSLPTTIVSEDFDGDGKIDIAAGGANVSVLRNTGTGTIGFDPAITLQSGSTPSSIAAVDLDNDGKKDIVISIRALSVLYIYRNTSPGPGTVSFAAKLEVAVTDQPSDLTAADFDGDGKTDLATSSDSASTVNVLKNSSPAPGTISFAAPAGFAVAPQPRSLSVGDMDGDTKIDIAAVSYSTSNISVLRNTSAAGTIQFDRTDGGGGGNLSAESTAIADIDGDGRLDVAHGNIMEKSVSVVLNTSSGPGSVSFGDRFVFGVGYSPDRVIAKDLDADGKLDLATANFLGNTVSVLKNTSAPGTSSFEFRKEFGTGGRNSGSVAAADFDGDGKPDLSVPNQQTNNVSVLRNKTFGSTLRFESRTEVGISGTTPDPYGVAMGDLDSDGRPDIVTANYTSRNITAFRNIGTQANPARFAPGANFPVTAPQDLNWIALSDIDGDGKRDAVSAGTSTILVSRNTTSGPGSISFASSVNFTVVGGPRFVALTDFDLDGKPDIATANLNTNTVSVLRNTSSPGTIDFAPRIDLAGGLNPTSLSFSDFDSDGKPDIAVGNRGESTVSVFRNTSSAAGTISFAAKIDLAANSKPEWVASGDFDGDGKADVAVSDGIGNTRFVSVMRNLSSGPGTLSFAPKVDFIIAVAPLSAVHVHGPVKATDMDGDGKLDLVAAGNQSDSFSTDLNVVSILKNTSQPGNLSFAAAVVSNTGAKLTSIDTGDLNNDNINEVIYSTEQSSNIGILERSCARNGTAMFDYDGDGKADISVFRPSEGNWYIQNSGDGSVTGLHFGQANDLTAPGDFDGDGRADISVYRPSEGNWYLLNSGDGSFFGTHFGVSGDKPAVGDFDGDGKADISVFRPSEGNWYRLNSSDGSFFGTHFGATEDKPAVGDFDGDGKADISLFRPSEGNWYRLNSNNGSFFGTHFGTAEDKPAPADYDGDGKTDISVYRPSAGDWFRLNSNDGSFFGMHFGASEDKPVAADFDGDGKADIAVFRPSEGNWYILNSTAGFFAQHFGATEDTPTPNSFVY
jgi:hypothetical protein